MSSSFYNRIDFSASESHFLKTTHFLPVCKCSCCKNTFKENILRSQEKSKERKVKEGNSLNLESIVFDLPSI